MLELTSANRGAQAHKPAFAMRGRFGLRALLICLALALGSFLIAPAAGSANPITDENALTGTNGWEVPQADTPNIDGYTTTTSVAPGGTIGFRVSTNPAAANNYRIRIYRLGWYNGLGARLVACVGAVTQVAPTC